MQQSKVFGIGLSKTGTTTLNEALQILGYSALHYPVGLRGVEQHDAATDTPIADRFEMLDRTYPGSKFVYTVRQRDDWLRSCKTHWARSVDPREEVKELSERLYGTAQFDAELFEEAYGRHEKRVLDYFSKRMDDLLVINLCSGNDEWAALCSFLGKKVPDCPFPHGNRTKKDLEHYFDNVAWLPPGAKKQLRRIRRKTSRIFFSRSRRHP
jgi:Sulfotransferase domain